MDLSSQEEEIPMPISSSYSGPPAVHGHGRMIHRDQRIPQNHVSTSSPQLIPSSNGPISMTTSTPTPDQDEHFNPNYNKKAVQASIRYRECLKNHAAAMGGNATDGCGEFMPSGEEGTLEALKCSACNCHRNFHRKEVEGDHHLHHPNSCDCNTDYHLYHHPHLNKMGRKVVLGPHVNHKVMLGNSEALGYPTAAAAINISSRPSAPVPNQMIMPYNLAVPSDQSDEQEGGSGHQGFNVAIRGGPQYHHQMMVKKRFRTKFTPEQKEKMLSFAQKVGWRIQKEEESVVQQFCQEIGVKRRVLKVWMHNNKHNLAKKNSSSNNNSDHHHHHQAIL